MKRILFLTVLLSLIAVASSAQNLQLQAPPGYNYIYPEGSTMKGTQGSPFLGDWEPADILFTNGGEIKGLMVRYNVLNNQLLYKQKDQIYLLVSPDSIAELNLPSRTFIYKEWAAGKKSFFEVVQKGKVSLLAKYEIEISPANYNEALMSGNKNDVLNLKQKMYLQLGEKFVPITKKNVLIHALGDKKADVSTFFSKERLSIKKREDMIELINFYNQL